MNLSFQGRDFEKLKAAFESRFVKKENGCWEWTGAIFSARGGYGSFICHPVGIHTPMRAHRVSFAVNNKKNLSKEEHVLHKCDNVLCVNPDHLFLGDQAANMADKTRKGRQNKGESHGMVKIAECDAIAIRGMMGKKLQKELAQEYNVSVTTISDIQRGRSWKHIQAARLG